MSKATPFNGLRNTVAALMRLMDGKADKDKVVSSVNGQTGDVTVEVPALPDNIVQSVNGAGPDAEGNVQVQVGVTSWNDLQCRPFREEKVVIEWDGVATEKYPTFADGSPMTNFYKISNVASLPTDGTSVQIIATSNGGNEEIIVASVMKLSDTVCGLMINEEPLFFVAAVDGAQYSLMGTTIICPEAGTYAYRGLSGETIPQVTIEYTTVKQLDPKFIPFAANVMKVTFVSKGMVGGSGGTPVFEPSHTLNDVLTAITMAGKTVIGEVVDDSGAGMGIMMGPACLGMVDSESMCVYFPMYDSEADGVMLPTNCLRLSSYSTYAELISAT